MLDSNVQPHTVADWRERFIRRDLPLAYLMVRATMGFHMIAHGGSRLPILRAFAAETRGEFAGVTLIGLPLFPAWLVTMIAYMIPPTEFVIGLLLSVGLKTRLACTVGNVLFLVMMFGTVARMEFGTGHVMWWYVMIFALLGGLSFNDRYSVDQMWK